MPRTKETRSFSGSIFRREIKKDGKSIVVWDARKRYKNAIGENKEKFKRCRSQKEANTALTNFQNEINDELSGIVEEKANPQQKTFLDLTKYFRDEYLIEAKIVDGRIIEGYRQNIQKLSNQIADFELFFGALPLPDLNYELIRKYKIAVASNPQKHKYIDRVPKTATVNRRLAMLRRILNVGVQLGWITHNPFVAGKSLIETRAETHRKRILTFDEEAALLDACLADTVIETTRKDKSWTMTFEAPRAHLYLILILALDTGMRKGEIFALRRNQVDLEKFVITLDAAQTKSFKSRTIPVTDRLARHLKERFDKNPMNGNDFVFGGIKYCRRSFNSVLKTAQITDVVFHSLRHTAITWMDLAGVSEMVKKNIVGHSTGDVHQDYHNSSENVLDDAREKMNAFRRKIDDSILRKKMRVVGHSA